MSERNTSLTEGVPTSKEFIQEMSRLVNKYHRMILEETEMTNLNEKDKFILPYEVALSILTNYMVYPNRINEGKMIPLSCGLDGMKKAYYQVMRFTQHHLKGKFEDMCPVCGSETKDNIVFMDTYKVCPNGCKEDKYLKEYIDLAIEGLKNAKK